MTRSTADTAILHESDRVVGFVQAREGSQRVRLKNLRLLGNRPMVSYAIDCMLSVPSINEYYINTESERIASLCISDSVKWYKRGAALASSEARTDDWVVDFLRSVPCDILVVLNPCVVFLRPETVERAVRLIAHEGFDTVISGRPIETHLVSSRAPINFDAGKKLPRSQDLEPHYALNFGVAAWRSKTFVDAYQSTGSGVLSGRVAFVSTPGIEGIDIDTEEDFRLAEVLIDAGTPTPPRYHPSVASSSLS